MLGCFFRALALGIAVQAIVLVSESKAQEWARFRGPNGEGVNERVSLPGGEWKETDIAFKVDLPGEGHSCPTVWGDNLFLLCSNRATAARHLVCLDANTGELKWKRDVELPAHHLHAKSSYASSTPALEENRVYCAFGSTEKTLVLAYDHAGEELWRVDIGGWVGQHGFGTSPVIVGDLIVVTSSQEPDKPKDGNPPKESFVIGIEKATGKVRWKTPRKIDTAAYTTPLLRETPEGVEVVMCSTAEGFFALDPTDGKEKWASEPVFTKRTVSSPVLAGDMIFGSTGSGGGGNYVVAVKFGRPATTVWEIKKEAPYVPSLLVKDELMFLWADGGIVTCVEWATGDKVWQERVGGKYSGSPVRDAEKLFCVDEEGTVVSLAAGREYKVLGRNKLGELCHSTPAIANGKLYVRTLNKLTAVKGEARSVASGAGRTSPR